jgi:uncharacterized protein (UPF0335 family)
MYRSKNPGVGPTGRPLPNPPTPPDVLDTVAATMNSALNGTPPAPAKKPRAPKATVAKDNNGRPVAKPSKAQAQAAINKARLAQEAATAETRHAAKAHFGGKARDKKLGGAQRDIEDPDAAGVHPEQKERETVVGNVAVDRLRQYIERIETLKGEQKALGADIADVFSEAKSAGFNPKAMRAVIAKRAMPAEKREEEENDIDLYTHALGI